MSVKSQIWLLYFPPSLLMEESTEDNNRRAGRRRGWRNLGTSNHHPGKVNVALLLLLTTLKRRRTCFATYRCLHPQDWIQLWEDFFFFKTSSWKKLISPHQSEAISVKTSVIYGQTCVWALKFEIDPDSKTVSSLGGFIIFARYICKWGKCDERQMQVRFTPFRFCMNVMDAALRLRP